MADDATSTQVVDDATDPKDDAAQDTGEAFDKDRALATINKLRGFEKMSKQQSKELDDLRAKVKASDDAKLSETERLTNRIAELERQHGEAQKALTSERTRNAVQAAATRAGAVNPEVVYRLLDADALELDSDGRPKNVEAAVKALLKENPYLARTNGSADGGAGGQQRNSGGTDMNSQIRHAMGRT